MDDPLDTIARLGEIRESTEGDSCPCCQRTESPHEDGCSFYEDAPADCDSLHYDWQRNLDTHALLALIDEMRGVLLHMTWCQECAEGPESCEEPARRLIDALRETQ